MWEIRNIIQPAFVTHKAFVELFWRMRWSVRPSIRLTRLTRAHIVKGDQEQGAAILVGDEALLSKSLSRIDRYLFGNRRPKEDKSQESQKKNA